MTATESSATGLYADGCPGRFQTGTKAVRDELIHVLVLETLVVALYLLCDSDRLVTALIIPTLSLALGLAGAYIAGRAGEGYSSSTDFPYWVRFYLTVAILLSGDVIVRMTMGGDVSMVFSGWIALIGSASAVHVFTSKIARRLVDVGSLARFVPGAWAVALGLQVAQLAVTLVGAETWDVMLVQVLVRRALLCVVVHVICVKMYGGHSKAAALFRGHHTLEYMLIWSISAPDGRVIEVDRREQTLVGSVLLKLPIFAGEFMLGGMRTLERIVDKLAFTEQIVAFSSPTFVTEVYLSSAHCAFIRWMLIALGDPTARNPRLQDPAYCKQWSLAFLRGGGHPRALADRG